MNGDFIRRFDTGRTHMSFLALDHKDGTLWSGDGLTSGTMFQYDRDGNELDVVEYDDLEFQYGGEFDLGAAAKIRKVRIKKGERASGDRKSLNKSDDNRMRIHSEPARQGARFVAELTFKSGVADPQAMDYVIDSRLDTRGGLAEVFFKNWTTGEFDEVDAYALPTEEERFTGGYNLLPGPSAYVRRDGKIVMRIRMSTPGRRSAQWKAFLNVVQVRVR